MIQYENVDSTGAPVPHQMSEAAIGHENSNPVAEQMELFPADTEVLTIQ